jgi:prophage antirepressor-like protein
VLRKSTKKNSLRGGRIELSQYQQEYETEEEKKRKRRLATHQMLSQIDRDVTETIAKEQKIRERMRFAKLASLSSNVVERGQYMVAAGLARVLHYENYRRWSLFESKKGIFSRKERHEEEESRESVYMEGYDD